MPTGPSVRSGVSIHHAGAERLAAADLWAVSFSHDRVWPGVHSGWMLRTYAATALTCGVAIDVPP